MHLLDAYNLSFILVQLVSLEDKCDFQWIGGTVELTSVTSGNMTGTPWLFEPRSRDSGTTRRPRV